MATIAIARPHGRLGGNLSTALRWERILTSLGHRVSVEEGWTPSAAPAPDLLIALNARRSATAIEAFTAAHPDGALIVAATGTDLYVDLPAGGAQGLASLPGFELADRILVLQELAAAALPEGLLHKTRVIHQSAQGLPATHGAPPVNAPPLQVSFLAELRSVKDPLLVLDALELLPAQIDLVVTHAGTGEDPLLVERATVASKENPRYEWVGSLPHRDALELLGRSHLTLNTSHSEGGAAALSEALALGVPIVASDAAGNRGILGQDHPGLFAVGNANALAERLQAAYEDLSYREALAAAGRARLPWVQPEREVAAWVELLKEVLPS